MSQISKENIENWFFKYSEGELSEEEKDVFMNFVMAHPELNDDFVLWSNVRLMPDLNISDFELENSLIKPEFTPLKNKYLNLLIFASIIGIVLSLWVFVKYNTINDKTIKPKDLPKSFPVIDVVPKTSFRINTEDKPKFKSEFAKMAVVDRGFKSHSKYDKEKEPVVKKEIYEREVVSVVPNTFEVQKDSLVADTIKIEQTVQLSRDVVGEKQKFIKNKRNKLSLKPNKDFKVDNPDF